MKSFVLCIAALVTYVAAAHAADEIHWTITGPTSVSLDWRGSETVVRYGLTPAFGDSVVAIDPTPMPFSSAGPFREARIVSLLPDTLYYYSIEGGPRHTFRTARRPGVADFTVMVEGDIGSVAKYPRAGVVQQLIADQRPAFALVVGDLTYANRHGQIAVDNHFNDVMVWSQDAAYMPAWGNHELDLPDDLRNYKGRVDLPNPRTSPGVPAISCCGEDWYWFDYGNVRFIAYPEPTSGAWLDWSKRAAAVMDSAQADPNITFIVTFGHRPAYSTGHHLGSATLKRYLDQLGQTHDKYKLNLNGHSHNYERSHPQSGVVHITAGGGGSTAGSDPSGDCLWRGGCPPPPWVAFRTFRHGPVKLSFGAETIKIEAICGPIGDNRNNPIDLECTLGTVYDSSIIGLGVANLPPNGDIIAPTGDVTIDQGQTVSFAGATSDFDGDTPFTYRWTFEGGAPDATVEDPGAVKFDSPGNYLVKFTVTDSRGLSDPTPGEIQVFVVPVNQPPVSQILSPSSNIAIRPGESVNFNGFAADPDGNTPLTFLWNFDGALPNVNVEDPGPLRFPAEGTFHVTFTPTDALGLPDPTPANRTVTVSNSANRIPIAVLKISPTTGISPLSVQADGRASTDSDGSITAYQFDFGDGTIIGPGPAGTASHTYTAGNWNARLTAFDDRGAAHTVTVPVLVAAPVPGNLVGNPSVETNLTGWKAYGTSTLQRVPGGFDGGYAMRATGGPSTANFGVNDSPNWVTSVPAALVGTPYRFSAWVRAPASSGKVRLQTREFNGPTLVGTVQQSTPVTLRRTWQRISLDHAPQVAGSSLDFQVISLPVVPGDTVFVDNVAIEATGAAATPASQVAFAEPIPSGVHLAPNPVREGGAITFTLALPGMARVQVIDVSGRIVRTLMDDPDAAAGPRRVWFDGSGAGGDRLASGMYFYRVETSTGTTTRRFAILR